MRWRTASAGAFVVAAFGIALFSLMDALMKHLALAIGAYDALLWRHVGAIPVSGLLYFPRWRGWPGPTAMRLHLVRGAVSTVMAWLFFWALTVVPMAQAIALAFIAPLISLFLAALILKERISRTTIAASFLAFAGVSVILVGQMKADLGSAALLGSAAVLASALCYAWNIILMRQQAQIAAPEEVAFFQNVIMGVGFALVAPWLAHVPAIEHVPALVGVALLATAALMLLGWAYARAEANQLASAEYTAFIWAALLGWLVFDEQVSLATLMGAAMIVTGCVASARQGRNGIVHVETATI